MVAEWILIADATRARVVAADPGEDLSQVAAYAHPGTHGLHHSEDHHFARLLAGRLEHAALAGRFRHLTVYATPPLLGELKQELGPHARKLLQRAEPRDLSAVPLSELPQRLGRLTEVM